ncbi:hypothetical protein LCL95_00935 [Bacillus timonensis]|nr:hypothetical protein [Bacillus timonensis]
MEERKWSKLTFVSLLSSLFIVTLFVTTSFMHAFHFYPNGYSMEIAEEKLVVNQIGPLGMLAKTYILQIDDDNRRNIQEIQYRVYRIKTAWENNMFFLSLLMSFPLLGIIGQFFSRFSQYGRLLSKKYVKVYVGCFVALLAVNFVTYPKLIEDLPLMIEHLQ